LHLLLEVDPEFLQQSLLLVLAQERGLEGVPRHSAALIPRETQSIPQYAPVSVGLWVEEDLGVTHALRGGIPEIRPGQLVEVTFVKHDLGALLVEVQEELKVREAVGRANIPHGPYLSLTLLRAAISNIISGSNEPSI
jgi:hypothetical protein